MKHHKLLRVIASSLALLMLLSACGTSPASPSDTGNENSGDPGASTVVKDTLTVAIPSDPNSLELNNNIEGYNGLLISQISETLVTTDDEGNIVPLLAESYEYTDDTTIVWHLQKNVTFHNGDKMTAEDVAYTFQRCAAHPVLSQEISNIDLENSYVEDDYTYVMKLHDVSAPLLYTLALTPFGIVSKAYCEANDDTTLAAKPVGTGPYAFVSWEVGSNVVLKGYENYWDTEHVAKIPNLIFKVVSEAANRTIELETGNVDLALDIQVMDASIIENDDDLNLLVGTGTGVTFAIINQRREPFDNVDVRLALIKAIDRDALCGAIYDEFGSVPNSVFAASLWAYDDTYAAEHYGYDPDAAKELLAGAGFNESNPLTIDIVVSESGNAAACAEIMRNMWEQVGIQANITAYEAGTYFEFFDNFDYDVTIATQTAASPDPDSVTFVIFSSFAMAMWSSPETDALLLQERAATDLDERREAFVEFQRICQERVAIAPLLTASVISAANKNLEGLPNYTYISNCARYNDIYWAN